MNEVRCPACNRLIVSHMEGGLIIVSKCPNSRCGIRFQVDRRKPVMVG